MKIKNVSLMIAIALSANSYASNDADETVLVVGSQLKNSISEEEIELKQADHLADLLRDKAGVDVGGTHQTVQRINIRGLEDEKLDITIDGAKQGGRAFHHYGSIIVNPEMLKSADIQVGNNSVTQSGIGGGVAFETKDAADLLKPGQTIGAQVLAGTATNNYDSYSAAVYGKLGSSFDALAYYSGRSTGNTEYPSGKKEEGGEGQLNNILIKAGWDISDTNRLELSYDNYDDSGDYPEKPEFGQSNSYSRGTEDVEHKRETLTLNHEVSFANTDAKSTIYANKVTHKQDSGADNVAGDWVPSDATGVTETYGAKTLFITHDSLLGLNSIYRYGGEYSDMENYRENFAEEVVVKKTPVHTSKELAVFVEAEIEALNGLYLTPGVRYTNYNINMYNKEDSFNETVFALAGKYEINRNWTTQVSAAQFSNGPELDDSFSSRSETKSFNLKPETGINYELSLNYKNTELQAVDRFAVDLTIFETHIDDYYSLGELSNDGDVKINGFEASMKADKGIYFATLSYAHSDSEYVSSNNDDVIVGSSLENQVGDSVALSLGLTSEETGLSVLWTSLVTFDLDAKTNSDRDKKGYDVHNINLQWTPKSMQDLTITAGIENIFNKEYVSHASVVFEEEGFDRPGSSFASDYEPGVNYKIQAAYKF